MHATTFNSKEEEAFDALKRSVSLRVSLERKKTEFAERVIAAIRDMYEAKEVRANFKLSTQHLPKYTKKVIEAVCKVPVGYVTSYGEVAKAVGGGPRAVGQIMARNPFAPICPCHRVVSSDCSLGGYGGGLMAKLRFLKRERRGYTSERQIPIEGTKLRVFPVERVISKVEKG